MSKPSNVPYEWSEIEAQVKEAVLAMATVLWYFGPQKEEECVTPFLGREPEGVDLDPMSIDAERHALYRYVQVAWCYAYQLDGWEDFTAEDAHEISCGLLAGGYSFTDYTGEPTGLDPKNDRALRRVLETAIARWTWMKEDSDLTVRQLSLLSGMAETTVRSSLSKEGFRLDPPGTVGDDKSSYTLSANDALQWLSRRRGFIPNATESSPDRQRLVIQKAFADPSVPFPTAVQRIAHLAGFADQHGLVVDPEWYDGLVNGKPVAVDVESLVALAEALGVSHADFAARGVRHLLELGPG